MQVHSHGKNRILAALPQPEFDVLNQHLELVAMPLGQLLYEPGLPQRYAYFPTTAIASLHFVTEDGNSSETAGVGNEGMVGVSIFMGGDTTSSSAVVQTAGHGYRIESGQLKDAFNRAGVLQALLLRYTQVLMTQTAQTVVCNRYHSIDQQLCRWFLLTMDRLPDRELVMTQELVSSMLGVRRESVTESAGQLQTAGYIRYRRGHITVLNRAGLERNTCGCYGVVKKELNRLQNDVLYR
jgi:CRP-like cAMP-binding protein